MKNKVFIVTRSTRSCLFLTSGQAIHPDLISYVATKKKKIIIITKNNKQSDASGGNKESVLFRK